MLDNFQYMFLTCVWLSALGGTGLLNIRPNRCHPNNTHHQPPQFQNQNSFDPFNNIKFIFRSARTSWNTFVRSSIRSPVGKKNLDQLYTSINHHRTTANLSDIVWCVSGGVWSMSGGSDACLVVSGGVNVYL